jgi:CheY-like chemotaxis protein
MASRVLLIDDDARFPSCWRATSRRTGGGRPRPDGGRGLAMLEQGAWDAVLLDVMMPGMDGLEVCKRIRAKRNVPIIMLTARGDETDRVVGLELGPTTTSPSHSPRASCSRGCARCCGARARGDERSHAGQRAVTDVPGRAPRRSTGKAASSSPVSSSTFWSRWRASGEGGAAGCAALRAGRGDVNVGERTVDVHISHLRQKLGDDPPKLIKTVRGVGYVLTKD